jgi:hypothetical protein
VPLCLLNIVTKFMAPRLIITSCEMDLLTFSFTVSLNHNQLQELTINLQPNPSFMTA